jgi:dipeptidyl aminopeptidase/acylaminoacyl peptidase
LPTRTPSFVVSVSLVILSLAAWLAGSAARADVAPPEAIVADGLPPIPDEIARRAGRYTEARAATFLSWHPSRREMLVQTRFAETAQIHEVRAPGGARRQLTFFPDCVLGAAYPPGGARPEHFVFQKDTGGGEFYQLYRYDPRGMAVTLLTDGRSRNSAPVFARSGAFFVYTSTRRNGADTDLYVMDPLDPKSDRRLAEVKGGGWAPLDVSPDEKSLLVLEYVSVNESYLWLFDLTSGQGTLLTPRAPPGAPLASKVRYDGAKFLPDGKRILVATDRDDEFVRLAILDPRTKEHRTLTAHIRWDVEEFDLTRDGRLVAFVTNEDGRSVLRLLDLRSGKERPRPATPPGGVDGVRFHPSGRELGFTSTSVKTPGDAYSLDLRSGKVSRWTESETGGLDTSGFEEPELVRFPSFDGRSISAYVYKPPARFTGKRPVVINIHGGPESQFRPGFLGRGRYYLDELGAAVVYPNVRGSTGYGKTFVTLDNGERREDSVKDIGALLDWIRTRPELDADRVLVMGGSYGGYMTFATAFHYPERIRAAIAVVGISNFVTFLERTEAYRRDLRRVEYGDERDPKMRAFLQKISPTTNAARITKPILVVQGKNDPRVPLGEAEQIVATLKRQRTPVWYLMAKDEGHGFAKKRNSDYYFYATVAFMQTFLLR